MKRVLSFLLAALMVLGLCACGKKPVEPALSGVAERVAEAVAAPDSMAQVDANYIKNMVGLDESAYTEAVVMTTNVGTSRDEYGVFKCADAKAAEAAGTILEAYIQKCIDTMMGYTPEELPKLEAAEIVVEGSYVMYAVLGDDAKPAAIKAFKDCFKEG